MANSPTLAELKARLEDLGCSITVLSDEITTPDGEYVVSAASHEGRFVALPLVPDGERISPWVIGNIERRLRIKTGFASL
ncbi:MAG: hypothetical protein KIS96_00390 [Bauldia sp.]|nr:hypothetical protein [Bauldia sp.]